MAVLLEQDKIISVEEMGKQQRFSDSTEAFEVLEI